MNILIRKNLLAIVKISRFVGWIIAPLVFIIGHVYSRGPVSCLSVFQCVTLSFPFSVLLFGTNDLYDEASDRLNPRKEPYLDKNFAGLIYRVSALTVLSLLLSSLLTLNYFNMLGTVSTLFFSYFYSAKPLRFKERPFLDSFTNGIIFFSVFSMGYSFGGGLSDIPLKIYYVALCVMGIHAFGAALDYDADSKTGQKTIAVYIGKRGAFLFTFLAFISSYLFSGIRSGIINKYFLFCSAISIIALVYPRKKLELMLFKLIFAGFVVTSLIFLINYMRA